MLAKSGVLLQPTLADAKRRIGTSTKQGSARSNDRYDVSIVFKTKKNSQMDESIELLVIISWHFPYYKLDYLDLRQVFPQK